MKAETIGYFLNLGHLVQQGYFTFHLENQKLCAYSWFWVQRKASALSRMKGEIPNFTFVNNLLICTIVFYVVTSKEQP